MKRLELGKRIKRLDFPSHNYESAMQKNLCKNMTNCVYVQYHRSLGLMNSGFRNIVASKDNIESDFYRALLRE